MSQLSVDGITRANNHLSEESLGALRTVVEELNFLNSLPSDNEIASYLGFCGVQGYPMISGKCPLSLYLNEVLHLNKHENHFTSVTHLTVGVFHYKGVFEDSRISIGKLTNLSRFVTNFDRHDFPSLIRGQMGTMPQIFLPHSLI
jgi:hypothetical protein